MTQISGTAFLVNYLRSKNKELSGDICSDATKYTYLTKNYFEKMDGYRIVDYTDYFDLEKRFTKNDRIRKNCDNVYPEDFVVLEELR